LSKKIKISDLIPDSKNHNKHTKIGMDLLEKSVNKVGVIESITVSNDNEIISGNARHEVIGRLYNTEPIIIETDGTRPIILKRTDIESNTKQFYEASILANTTSKKNIDIDFEQIEILENEYGLDAIELGVDEEKSYSDKNKEINIDEMGNEMVIKLKYTEDEYNQVKAAFSKLAQTPEQAVWQLLKL